MISENVYESYLHHLVVGHRKQTSEIIHTLIEEKIPVPIIYEGLIQKSMYRIGELWEQNKVSIATEHLATAITEMLLNQVYSRVEHGKECGKEYFGWFCRKGIASGWC